MTITIEHADHVTLQIGDRSTPADAILAGALASAFGKAIPKAATPSRATPPKIGERWTEQGGIYAGVMRGFDGHPDYHLIVADGEAHDIRWGPRGHAVAGADSDHDGLANTLALFKSDQTHPAAEWAYNAHTDAHRDHYLPSRRELRLCWANVPELFDKDVYYWSSTQYSAYGAWLQGFSYGNQYGDYKDYGGRARAVRRLIL